MVQNCYMSAGRPKEFDQHEALEAAMQVFWMRGYDATSLEELLQAMGIAKSSFYQTFGSKPELFQRCLCHYRDMSAKQLQAALTTAPSAWDFLRTTLESVAESTGKTLGRAGCLLMNTASEFGQRDPEVSGTVSEAMVRMERIFLKAVERCIAEGSIPSSADPRSLALFLTTNLGGLKGMARSGASPDAMRRVVNVALSALK